MPKEERGKALNHGNNPRGAPNKQPCRVLFVRNIAYGTSVEHVREMFEKFGEIKSVFSLIEKRGMIFITFV